MRVPRRSALVAALLLAATALVAGAPPAGAEIVDRVVLRVNDLIATQYEYEARRARWVAEVSEREDLTAEQRERLLADAGKRIYRNLLEELLMKSRADQLRIRVTDEQVDQTMVTVRESFGIENDDRFAAELARQGLTLGEFREQIRQQLVMRELTGREIHSQIGLEEDDLRRFYRANPERFTVPRRWRVRELIVLEREGVSATELADLARNLRAQVATGRSLDTLAASYAEQGITSAPVELGWVHEGELDPALEAAITELEVGEVSDPVAARGGYHILELQELQEPTLRPFAEVAEDIDRFERARLFNEKITEYMRDLEEKAYLVLAPPPDAIGFQTFAETAGRDELMEILRGVAAPSADADEADGADDPDASDDADEAADDTADGTR